LDIDGGRRRRGWGGRLGLAGFFTLSVFIGSRRPGACAVPPSDQADDVAFSRGLDATERALDVPREYLFDGHVGEQRNTRVDHDLAREIGLSLDILQAVRPR
jgi:hypothetical protein